MGTNKNFPRRSQSIAFSSTDAPAMTFLPRVDRGVGKPLWPALYTIDKIIVATSITAGSFLCFVYDFTSSFLLQEVFARKSGPT